MRTHKHNASMHEHADASTTRHDEKQGPGQTWQLTAPVPVWNSSLRFTAAMVWCMSRRSSWKKVCLRLLCDTCSSTMPSVRDAPLSPSAYSRIANSSWLSWFTFLAPLGTGWPIIPIFVPDRSGANVIVKTIRLPQSSCGVAQPLRVVASCFKASARRAPSARRARCTGTYCARLDRMWYGVQRSQL